MPILDTKTEGQGSAANIRRVDQGFKPILEAESLVKSFGRRKVVDGVSFAVDYAEIVGLLGPNGAGKTTSFRMTCGMIEPDQGRVTLNDVDVTTWPMYRRAKEGGMGYLAQEPSVFKKLTVEQNLLGIMELLGVDRPTRKRRCDESLEQFGITHIRRSKAGSLSGGERRRLEIARCLLSDPEIILLDEPFTGIDPVTIEDIQKIIRKLKERGISILITDHQVRETLDIVDRAYVIFKGAVLCQGKKDEVLAHPLARERYFGSNIDPGTSGGPGSSFDRGPPGPPPPHIPSAPPERPKPAPAQSAVPSPHTPSPSRPRRTNIHEEETLRDDL
jgi:lipopolysaccharide export system ATP-binding protein